MTSSCCFSNLTMSQDDSLVFNFVLKDAGISEVMLLAYEVRTEVLLNPMSA